LSKTAETQYALCFEHGIVTYVEFSVVEDGVRNFDGSGEGLAAVDNAVGFIGTELIEDVRQRTVTQTCTTVGMY